MKFIKKFSSMAEYEAADLSYPATSLVSGTVIYDKEAPAPPTTFKWKATYTGGTISSAECDSTSAITQGEINSTNLESVEIGDCVTGISRNAFYQNYTLSSATISDTVLTIGETAFSYCSGLTSVTIGSGVTSIGIGAFSPCRSLSSVTLPDSVTDIGGTSFYNCDSLTSINIPSGVTNIGYWAFQNCSSLTSITIPDSVTSIGNETFYGCRNLTDITVEATTPPTLGTNVFTGTNNCPIYVPASSVNAYRTATNWSTYASRIQAIA